jgi:hypothetical protein
VWKFCVSVILIFVFASILNIIHNVIMYLLMYSYIFVSMRVISGHGIARSKGRSISNWQMFLL